jgi:hypothetical protein
VQGPEFKPQKKKKTQRVFQKTVRTNKFSKVAGYKSNKQKSVLFLSSKTQLKLTDAFSSFLLPLFWVLYDTQGETVIGYDTIAGTEENFHSLMVSSSCFFLNF